MKRLVLLLPLLALAASQARAEALTHASPAVEAVQKSSENQIRRLIEPLLDKYCHDQCKLLAVSIDVDVSVPEETAPGFDEIPSVSRDALAPSSGKVKLLLDDKLGPVSRRQLLDLIQQYLDTLDYPVKIDTILAHFPSPAGSEGKIADLRDQVAKKFQNTVSELIQQFCPEQCLMTDFDLKTEVVNAEEAQYGSPGEFVQDGPIALKIKEISGTLLMDESLTPQEQGNILELIRLKTNSFKHVNLSGKAIKFPRPGALGPYGEALAADGTVVGGRVIGSEKSQNSTSNNESKSQSLNDSRQSLTSSQREDRNSTTNSTSRNEQNNRLNNSTQSTSNETSQKQERYERLEKIERVENGDAVQAELKKLMVYALIFGCAVLSLLIFIAVAGFRSRKDTIQLTGLKAGASGALPVEAAAASGEPTAGEYQDRLSQLTHHFEISRLTDELLSVFAQHPKVAKHVFSRVLTEEGIEVTAQYVSIFGESIMIEMLRDPSLQSDLNELLEYYAKTVIELKDDEKLDLLKKLHQRTIAGKLAVMGNRSSNLFDFLAEMDGMQILEMIRAESLTVKAIILTQCDAQKRSMMYQHMDDETRRKLLTELSRIDYLPRDYIFNVANALKRKRRENPRLNTEALPGSEVLVSLLERTGTLTQRDVIKTLEASNPESARTVKGKLVSVETLRYLRDGQLLEVVLSLRHDELLQFLKGAPDDVRQSIFDKSPPELAADLEEELQQLGPINRETYFAIERKVLNRMKLMANDGLINLVETNERMFDSEGRGQQPPNLGSVAAQQARRAG